MLYQMLQMLPVGETIELVHANDDPLDNEIRGTAASLRYFFHGCDFVVTNVDTNYDGEIRLWVKRLKE